MVIKKNMSNNTSWKRYFTSFDDSFLKRKDSVDGRMIKTDISSNWASYLPEVYSGAPNRIERYAQYDHMDLDPQISSALDIIAEFCTTLNQSSNMCLKLHFNTDPTPSQTDILDTMLKKWYKNNDFKKRMFEIVRDAAKYGDSFFIRDPETFKLYRVSQSDVVNVVVDESHGKKPVFYRIRNFNFSIPGLFATQEKTPHTGSYPLAQGYNYSQMQMNQSSNFTSAASGQGRFSKDYLSMDIDASHVLHFTMNDGSGTGVNYPFGTSILERVYKKFKQKELIEDSIVIYRVQRAPERRVFYIDVGDMNEAKAMQYTIRIKNEIQQKRIPSKSGGSSLIDSGYNPLSMLEDFYFPQRSTGQGSKVETLPGGDPTWGLNELQYFNNELNRGLRVPVSYLPSGADESPQNYNDGRVGTALIQELRFSEYCKRIQNALVDILDQEFKLFLKYNDINITSDIFDLVFVEPQNYAAWRQIDLDQARINNFSQLQNMNFMSKRFLLQKYLGWEETDINKNHKMVIEENPKKFKNKKVSNIIDPEPESGLRSIGINPVDLSNVPEEPSVSDVMPNEIHDNDIDGDISNSGEIDTDNI